MDTRRRTQGFGLSQLRGVLSVLPERAPASGVARAALHRHLGRGALPAGAASSPASRGGCSARCSAATASRGSGISASSATGRRRFAIRSTAWPSDFRMWWELNLGKLKFREHPNRLRTPEGQLSLKPLRALLPFLAPYRGRMLVALSRAAGGRGRDAGAAAGAQERHRQGFQRRQRRCHRPLFPAGCCWPPRCSPHSPSLRMYLVNWIGERVVADLRSAVYARVHPHGSRVLRGDQDRRGALAANYRHHADPVAVRHRAVDPAALDR